MADQKPGSKQSYTPEDYRGALVYSQEDRYKLITMQVHLFEGEKSSVMSHAYNLPLTEKAEHLPADSPLAGVDVYHFSATNGTNILLTVEGQETKHTAVYSIRETDIEEHTISLRLDVMESEKGKMLDQEPQAPQDWETAFDEAIDYYKDQVPLWLDLPKQHDTRMNQPFHDHDRDFGR